MFNSLGNIESDPRAGLLFIDFSTGTTLHASGRASVVWPPDGSAGSRLVRLTAERVEQRSGQGGLVWRPSPPPGR